MECGERLAPLNPEQRELEVAKLDRHITLLARLIRYPGVSISMANLIVRLSEGNHVPQIIDALS